MPRLPPIEEVSTIAAPLPMSGRAFWTVKKTPFRFTAITRSQSSSETRSIGRNAPTPAFTNSTSMRPSCARTSRMSASISARLDVSERMASAPAIDEAAWRSVAVSRPVMTTRAPSAAKACAEARPMPLLPPVTTTTLSLNLDCMGARDRFSQEEIATYNRGANKSLQDAPHKMRKAAASESGRSAARGRDEAHDSGTASSPSVGRACAASAAGPALSQQSVWYRLMKLTNLINRPFFSRYAERYHLTINDARVLVTLASMPEAAAHELCEATGMHPMNVSRSVATLRRQGRITERRDPANRRRKMLRLTPKGWSTCRSFVPDMERMSSFLLASMSPLEVEFLGRLVDQLIARLETIDSGSGLPEDGAAAA